MKANAHDFKGSMSKIVLYNDSLKTAFKDLNVEWLSDMFVVEPYDLKVLSDPDKYILSGGGNIWIYLNDEGEAVGTCALMEHDTGHYELTKMAVSKKARGLGAGRKLLKYVIDEALKLNPKSLFLLTSSKCEAAIHLYEEEGFERSSSILKKYGASYNRSNVGMFYPISQI